MNKKNLRKNGEEGITLVALIITIIVLLILAGVTIVTLTGENKILNQANQAKIKSDIAVVKEKAQLDIANWTAEKLKNGEDTTLNDATVKSIIESANQNNTNKYYSELTEISIKTKQGNEILFSDLYTKILESGDYIFRNGRYELLKCYAPIVNGNINVKEVLAPGYSYTFSSKETIDVSKYSKLCFNCKIENSSEEEYNGSIRIGLVTAPANGIHLISSRYKKQQGYSTVTDKYAKYELDISNISGSYYIAFALASVSTYKKTIDNNFIIKEIWLEE